MEGERRTAALDVPCFLWIFASAPFVERLRGNKALSAALATVTAAIVGVILNLAIWFALHSLFGATGRIARGPFAFDYPIVGSVNLPALALTVLAMIAMFRFRIGAMPVLAMCALAGVGYWFITGANPA